MEIWYGDERSARKYQETMVMCSKGNRIPLNKSGKKPCAVCWEVAEIPSIATPAKTGTEKCTTIKGSLSRVKNIVCKRCLGEILSVSESENVCLIDDDLELV